MNEIIDALLTQVMLKLKEKDIPNAAREVLANISKELTDMSKETWTLDRITELNEKTESMSKRLKDLKEQD